MKDEIELLAPGGDADSVKAAVAAGADAVYCGLNRFNARNRASNLDFDKLNELIVLAHKNNCKIFLTLNIIFVDSEIPALFKLLNQIANTKVDGVIVQDLGVLFILEKYFKNIEVHASTQLTTHNRGHIEFLEKLRVSRVNLSRELNKKEIKNLTCFAHDRNIEIEVFVHGSYCIGFSGLCYFSSFLSGNSGNRGRCSQPCRDIYKTTFKGMNYPLNLRDNSAFKELKSLFEADVDSLKIEGRIKGADYVYTAVNAYKKQMKRVQEGKDLTGKDPELKKVFNRTFSDSFLTGKIGLEMFIDDPRDAMNALSQKEQEKIYDEKELIKDKVRKKITDLKEGKEVVKIHISGSHGEKLLVKVKTDNLTFNVSSKSPLSEKNGTKAKDLDLLFFTERFKTLNDGSFVIKEIDLDSLNTALFIPFGEITKIKNEIFFRLNGFEYSNPVEVPKIKKSSEPVNTPELSLLISSENEINDIGNKKGEIFFKLPESLKHNYSEIKQIFLNNDKLVPWFPEILLNEDYESAVDFLKEINPGLIVTNNSGVALEAFKRDIGWIAGPHMNIANSFSMICLKEKFNCKGAFISNELSRLQVKQIIKPENFRLFYSICHPILLLKSRQCLFQQVTGCGKELVDEDCLKTCEKYSFITNMNGTRHILEKSKGNHNSLFNNHNYLNTDAVKVLKGTFTDFLFDLQDIKTETVFKKDKVDLIKLFNGFLKGDNSLENEIHESITPTTTGNWHKRQGAF